MPRIAKATCYTGELHVDTPIATIKVRAGLHDDGNRNVVRVEIVPSEREPTEVVLDGCSVTRAVELKHGETSLPPRELAPGVKDPECMSRDDLVALVRYVQKLFYYDFARDAWDPDHDASGGDVVEDLAHELDNAGLVPSIDSPPE